jgi:hypothetical protein
MKLFNKTTVYFKKSYFLFFLWYIKDFLILPRWFIKKKPIPAPNIVKFRLLKEYQKKFNLPIFIETGTFYGSSIFYLRKHFKKIYSIELSKILYQNAKERLSKFKNITLIRGDSAKILPKLLKSISTPCFFWLDGHYSGGITAKSKIETPILQEINAISDHKIKTHVIAIDDARLFDGGGIYPNLSTLFKKLKKINKNYNITIIHDIIFAVPK